MIKGKLLATKSDRTPEKNTVVDTFIVANKYNGVHVLHLLATSHNHGWYWHTYASVTISKIRQWLELRNVPVLEGGERQVEQWDGWSSCPRLRLLSGTCSKPGTFSAFRCIWNWFFVFLSFLDVKLCNCCRFVVNKYPPWVGVHLFCLSVCGICIL